MLSRTIVKNQITTIERKDTTMNLFNSLRILLGLAISFSCLSGSARATVLGLESIQASTATHAWSFETPDPLNDKTSNTNNLSQTGTVGTTPGFNGDGVAADFNGSATGYYLTSSTIGGNDMTWEFLINPGTQVGEQHFLGTVQPGTNRFYAIDTGSEIQWKRGDNTPLHRIVGGTSPVAYDPSHWYYIGLQSSFNAGTNQYTVDAFARDLTADGAFTQVVTNLTNTYTSAGGGDPATFRLGLQGNGSPSLFNGDLDAVAFYDSLLSAATLEANSDAALHQIPEPASGLMLLGGFGMLVRWRRVRRNS